MSKNRWERAMVIALLLASGATSGPIEWLRWADGIGALVWAAIATIEAIDTFGSRRRRAAP